MNVLRFASWMRDRGHQVTLCCVLESPIHQSAIKQNLNILLVKRNRKYFDLPNAFRISRLVNHLNVDVVWFRDNRDLSVLAWAKFFGGKFRLLYQQAMQLGVDKKDPFHTWRFNRIDVWVAPLKFLADQVRSRTRFSHHKITTIPLAIDQKKFNSPLSRTDAKIHLKIDKDAIWMGVIGRFDPLKGQHLAVEALSSLQHEFTNLKLLLVGESTRNESSDYENSIRSLIHAHNLENKVMMMPFRTDVENVYKALDFFILTSEGETFGMVTIEAMSSGCCVIGTNSSGTPEILGFGNYGALFNPGNSKELASCIKKLMDQPVLRERMISNSKEAVSSYNHQIVCTQLENAIANVVGTD